MSSDNFKDARDEDPRPVAYQPLAQYPAPFASRYARTAGDPTLLATALQKAVTDGNPNVAVTGTNTIDALLDQTLYGTRTALRSE